MKIYNKPEIEIVEFDIAENLTQEELLDNSNNFPDVYDMSSDEIFYGAGEQGYLVNQ